MSDSFEPYTLSDDAVLNDKQIAAMLVSSIIRLMTASHCEDCRESEWTSLVTSCKAKGDSS